MHKVMNYVRNTASFGNFIKPDSQWNNTDKDFKFVITGLSDSEYASDPDTRRSVSGGTVFLCNMLDGSKHCELLEHLRFELS
jgi:hypothetical protein